MSNLKVKHATLEMSVDIITTNWDGIEQCNQKTVVEFLHENCETWDQNKGYRTYNDWERCPGCEECAIICPPVRARLGEVYFAFSTLDECKSLAFIGVYTLRTKQGRTLFGSTSLKRIKQFAEQHHNGDQEIMLKTGIPVMVSIHEEVNAVEDYFERIQKSVEVLFSCYVLTVPGPEFFVASITQELVTTFE